MPKPLNLDSLSSRVSAMLPKQAVPGKFVDFCSWVGVTLRPGQRVLASIAYDGAEPQDLQGTDRDLARLIFGDIDTVPAKARSTIAAVVGARGGKSYTSALRMVWGALIRDLSSVAPGQMAVSLVIAPNETLRREVVNYAVGVMQAHPVLSQMIQLPKGKKDGEPTNTFSIRRPDDRVVIFEAGIASRGGYGARGRSLVDFCLDETAFFLDSSYKTNDTDIYTAGSARVLPTGQTLVLSTPWGESGLLYELYQKNFGKPNTALVAHAPTLIMHDSPMTKEIVAREYERDPDNADREFGAKFMQGGTNTFFTATEIDGAVDASLGTGEPV